MGARGHGIVIAQKMSIVLGQVVENQRSVQRTVRRDRTTSFLFSHHELHHYVLLRHHCLLHLLHLLHHLLLLIDAGRLG